MPRSPVWHTCGSQACGGRVSYWCRGANGSAVRASVTNPTSRHLLSTKTQGYGPLYRWICNPSSEEEPKRLPPHARKGWKGVAGSPGAPNPRGRRGGPEKQKRKNVSSRNPNKTRREGAGLFFRVLVAR